MSFPGPDRALEILGEGQEALDRLFARLSDEAMVQPATIGGGDWSAQDLLGHLAYWQELAADAIADWRSGQSLRYWRLFENSGGIDGVNAQNQAVTSAQSLAQVRERADRSRKALIAAITSLTEGDWVSDLVGPAGGPNRLDELLGGILGAKDRPFGHAFAHLNDLAAYVARAQRDLT
jgi:hypothetical protein